MDTIIVKRDGKAPVVVLKPVGEINMATFPAINTAARAEIDAGNRNMVIDLTAVPYMTSAGIRLLNGLFKLLRTNAPAENDAALSKGLRDGTFKFPHLKLVNPSESVHDVIKTTGLDMVFDIYGTVDEALASF